MYKTTKQKRLTAECSACKSRLATISSASRKAYTPLLHEEDDSQENNDEEQDASDDPGDLDRVVRLFFWLHCVGLVSG